MRRAGGLSTTAGAGAGAGEGGHILSWVTVPCPTGPGSGGALSQHFCSLSALVVANLKLDRWEHSAHILNARNCTTFETTHFFGTCLTFLSNLIGTCSGCQCHFQFAINTHPYLPLEYSFRPIRTLEYRTLEYSGISV